METGWNRIELGGVAQWVSLRGDPRSPLLLWLHGGPGGSEYGARRRWLSELERRFYVAEWEQRGAGRSYRGDETGATLNLERLVADGVELIGRLCAELHHDRLVLVGHSFGSALGVRVATRVPGSIAAYVGTGQVVCWALQEERSYAWALAEARRRGRRAIVDDLERIGPPVRGAYAGGVRALELQRRHLGSLGGVAADPSFLLRWVGSLLLARDYPLAARLRFTAALRRSLELLWPELGERIDLARDVREVAFPVFLLSGRGDRITDLGQVEAWAGRLAAPHLRHVIVDAGHLAVFERPREFLGLMDEVRAHVTGSPGRQAG